jgi:hypothetical protein
MNSSKLKDNINLVNSGFLEKLQLGEDRPLVKEDFSSKINDRLDTLNRLYALVHTVPPWLPGLSRNQTGKKKFLVPLILLCGENVQSTLWTNSKIIQTSYLILSTLKKDVFKTESVSEIFNNDEEFLQLCLKSIQEKLEDDWRSYPGAQYCFSWLLRQVSGDLLRHHLQEFLPFALRFLDDWQLENKTFALHCLDHILDNVQKQDLTKFGHADVIQSALFHVQVHRDIEVLSVAYDCTFKFLQKTIPVNEPAKYDAWDELTKKLLYNMETESNPELKHFYGQKLLQLLPFLGLGTVRWLSTLLPIISTHTQIPHCRQDGLIILSNILDVCSAKKAEERIKFHVDTIYEPLIRLLYDLNTDEQVFKMSSDLLRRVANISKTEFRLQFEGFEEQHNSECDADRVVGEILSGIL